MEPKKDFMDYMQVKFNEFINIFKSPLPLPYFNCLKETLPAMIVASAPIIRQIAQRIKGDTSLKKKQEKISYNLSNKKNFEKLNNAILLVQSKKIKEDTLIIIDESDIAKPNAKCMQHSKMIRDGSTGGYVNGYNTINAITIDVNKSGRLKVNPLHTSIYSNDIEMDSKNTKIMNLINEITVYSGNKGIFVFDRGYDSRKFIEELVNNENDFVIRSVGNRSLVVDDKKYSCKEALELVELKYKYKCPDQTQIIKYGVMKVGVITDPHLKKNPTTVSVYLIKARYNDNGGFFYCFAYFKDNQITYKQLGEKVLEIYRKRWKIEEFFRHIKTEYKLEHIQLLNYDRLQSLYLWMFLMIIFVYSCNEILYIVPKEFKDFVYETNKETIATTKYHFYKVSTLIKVAFLTLLFGRRKKRRKKKKDDPRQLTLESNF